MRQIRRITNITALVAAAVILTSNTAYAEILQTVPDEETVLIPVSDEETDNICDTADVSDIETQATDNISGSAGDIGTQTYDEDNDNDNDGNGETDQVIVKAPKLASVTDRQTYISVKWTLPGTEIDGMQIKLSRKSSFKPTAKSVLITDPKAVSVKIDGLKENKTYYIHIRSFRKTKKGTVYSGWSKPKEVTFAAKIKELSITNKRSKTTVGKTFRLRTHIEPEGLKGQEIKWKSSDEKVATVDEKGRVTVLHSGNVRITASCGKKKDSCRIKVNIKGIITMIDDDGWKAFKEKLLPIVKEKKVSIATAVIPRWVGSQEKFMTWDEIEKCKKGGAEILCHTYRHRDVGPTMDMKQSEIEAEYAKAKRIMKRHGYDTNVLVYSHRTGEIKKAQKAASKVFDCAIIHQGFTINDPDSNMYALERYDIEGAMSERPQDLKDWIDQVKKDGGWMIWELHCGMERVNDKALDNLRDAFDYAKEQGVEIVTAAEGYERLANE